MKKIHPTFLCIITLFPAMACLPLDHLEIQLKDSLTSAPVSGKPVTLTYLDKPSVYQQSQVTDEEGLAIFTNVLTAISNRQESDPYDLRLSQNYPNPFNPGTAIPFSTQHEGEVDLHIYNILGQEVKHLVDQWLPAGKHEVYWSGTKDDGSSVSTGIYFARMIAGGESHTVKMTLMDGNVTAVSGYDGDVNTLENHGIGYKVMKVSEDGEPYVVEVPGDENYLGLADTVYVNANTGRLTYDLAPVAVNNPPNIELDDTSTLEDNLLGVVYDLHSQTTDESPDSMLTYEILSESNPDLVSFEIQDNRYLKMKSLKSNSSGSSEVTIRVTDPDGAYTDVTFVQDVLPQADIIGTLKDPVTKAYVDNVSGTIGGAGFTSDANGNISVQVPEGSYVFQTDTTGGRMQTYWDLGEVGTEDVNLDSLLKDTPLKAVPVAYKNDNMVLMVDAKGAYETSDRENFATNRMWDPNKIYQEGLPRGTLRTVYVNASNLSTQTTQDNLDWAVDKSKESTDNLIRLQMPSEADNYELPANSAAEEAQIYMNFMKGDLFPEYDAMVLVSRYIGDANVSNANDSLETYVTRGAAVVSSGGLYSSRAGALSEITTMLQIAEDVTPAKESLAAGTMYGKTDTFDHEQGYMQTVSYGPPGAEVVYSPEQHIGKLMMNIPLNTMILKQALELPKPDQ